MKLCSDCRWKMPFLVVYVVTLATVVALATGLVFSWNRWLTVGIFLVWAVPGLCYIYGSSCEVCRLFHRHRSRLHTRSH